MPPDLKAVFSRLRGILQRHAETFSVTENTASRYALAGGVGSASLQAWGGKMKKAMMPVGWVQIGKAYVSYHLLGLYGNEKLLLGMSKELKARMQGKTCFNFKSADEALFKELEELTARTIAGFKAAGFVTEQRPR
jgi:hypothetical protein